MNWPQLSNEQKDTIVRALRTIDELIRVVDALEQCGEDCQIRRQAILNTRTQLNALLQHFAT